MSHVGDKWFRSARSAVARPIDVRHRPAHGPARTRHVVPVERSQLYIQTSLYFWSALTSPTSCRDAAAAAAAAAQIIYYWVVSMLAGWTALALALVADDADRYFEGERRIRLLSILVSFNGLAPEYAGSTAAEREAWAHEQRALIDVEYRGSTYDKLGINETGSRVMTVDLGDDITLDASGCKDRHFELAALASDELSVASHHEIDAVLYYQPDGLSPAEGGDSCLFSGVCYMGVLNQVNKEQAVPPYVLEGSSARSERHWNAGCLVRFQPDVAAKASIASHELGHHLGLHHAAGRDQFGRWTAFLVESGDTGSIMGNGGLDTLNRFSAPARYYLGVVPYEALALGDDAAHSDRVRLRAISRGPDPTGRSSLALVFDCPTCEPQVEGVDGASNLQMWIVLDDGFACNLDYNASANALDCHRNAVVTVRLSYRWSFASYGPTTEKLYWLKAGEAYTWPTGGKAVAVCDIHYQDDPDSAIVAVAPTAEEASAKCAVAAPPPSPPPPAPPVSSDASADASISGLHLAADDAQIRFGLAADGGCTIRLDAGRLVSSCPIDVVHSGEGEGEA